jgi:hypothetical protein
LAGCTSAERHLKAALRASQHLDAGVSAVSNWPKSNERLGWLGSLTSMPSMSTLTREAFDLACRVLGQIPPTTKETIATRVIKEASSGERDLIGCSGRP